jgi:hypothetical protein
MKFLYRQNTTTVGGVTYLGDTLVFSVINMSAQTTNFVNRNIASEISIIPNPIRSQEVVGILDSTVSDINRPILLTVDNKYATTKLPNTHKATTDIGVIPTFHLEDPSLIVTGTNPRWAYRFDFTSMSTLENAVRYKTPWRHLPVGNTIENQTGVENTPIAELHIAEENLDDLIYTYYMISDKPHSWYQVTNATAYLSSLYNAESILYNRMRLNGATGSSGTTLGNLAFAYLKLKTVVDTLRASSITLDQVESTLYEQMDFRFITEDSLIPGVTAMGYDLETLTSRDINLTTGEVSTISSIYPTVTTDTVNAPIVPLTYAAYIGTTKMTFADFILHATEKQKTHKIRIVFVPYIYRHAGLIGGVTPTDNVYLCSLGGVYITGLKAYPTSATNDIAAYPDLVSVKKSFTFKPINIVRYVDVFSNLGNLNIKDTLSYIPRSCFDIGVFLTLYLKPYTEEMLNEYAEATTQEKELYNTAWDSSAFTQKSEGVWMNVRDVVYLDEVDEENPAHIRDSENAIVFEDRLVIWNGNKVFVSEEGDYYYFTSTLKKIFPEEVLKVIAFKTTLLVFTTQNLYAIYRAEVDTPDGFTAQGEQAYVKEIVWLQQPVLYNINPERKYLDMIQVYNQMILFYSNEGQLYMIKPSTMIDSETQFAIQYFNKSANNILANYEQYINERLKYYNKLDVENPEDYVTKADVQVKGLIDIDQIKIIYSVPGRITFILIYDVVNNRYTTYDTLSFTNVISALHVEGGECYITKHNDNTFFTLPVLNINNVDLNTDMHYAAMFRKEPLFSFIDTGNMNLNNHITKRLRDLRIVLKNLDSTKILYNAELLLDDSVIHPFYAPDFRVRMLNGPDSTMVVDRAPVEDMNELFGMIQEIGIDGARSNINSYYLYNDNDFFTKNSLLKTETLNSSRLIEYNSSILGVGKVIRIRMQFISKGKYKLQSFGITYKERHL